MTLTPQDRFSSASVQHDRQDVACAEAGRYRADITAGSLKLTESRIIADLLLHGVDDARWKEAMVKDNVLKVRNPATAIRLARLIRHRLEMMTPELWRLVRDGTVKVATHAIVAAAIKHSYLLGGWKAVSLFSRRLARTRALCVPSNR